MTIIVKTKNSLQEQLLRTKLQREGYEVLSNEIAKSITESTGTLTDQHFTDPTIFGCDDLVEMLEGIVEELHDEIVEFVDSEEGQGYVEENNDVSLVSDSISLKQKLIEFKIDLSMYFRNGDDKGEECFMIDSTIEIPLIDNKIDSMILDDYVENDGPGFKGADTIKFHSCKKT